jgi:hypothetical protein
MCVGLNRGSKLCRCEVRDLSLLTSDFYIGYYLRVYLMVMLVQINNPISMLYCQRHHFDIFFVYLYRKWLYVIYVEKVATAVINVLTGYVTTVIFQKFILTTEQLPWRSCCLFVPTLPLNTLCNFITRLCCFPVFSSYLL